MQRCNVMVALNGDTRNTVYKMNVSVAEILVLEAIHGEGSVSEVHPTENDKTPHAEERDRLKSLYAPTYLTDGEDVVSRLFPGAMARLPVSLDEIGKEKYAVDVPGTVQEEDDEDEDGDPVPPPPPKKKASKKKAAKKTAAKPQEDEEGNVLT